MYVAMRQQFLGGIVRKLESALSFPGGRLKEFETYILTPGESGVRRVRGEDKGMLFSACKLLV